MLVIRPYRVILFLTIFIPFQETIYKWLPVPDRIYIWLRLLSELVLYTLFILVIIKKIIIYKKLQKTPIDLLVIIFLGLTITSMVLNQSFSINSLINLRVLLRYLAIYYLIVNIPITRKQISTLLGVIMVIGLLEGFLSLGQYISADFNQLFVLRDIDVEIIGIAKDFRPAKVGAVIGTFGTGTEMALFLLIALIIYLAHCYRNANRVIPSPTYLVAILIILWGIFATFKRAALLIVPILFLAVLLHSHKRNLLKVILFSLLLIIMVLLFIFSFGIISFDIDQHYEKLDVWTYTFPIDSFLIQPFTTGYWDHILTVQRGWFIKEVSGAMIRDVNLLGYGPDEGKARDILASTNPSEFGIFSTGYEGFEDVYWVAMLVYYGIIGLIIYFFLLYRLYRTSRWVSKHALYDEFRILGVVFCTIIILVIFYTFIERTFELRAFGYYFWLLAGLVVNAFYTSRNNMRLQNNLVQKTH